MAQDQILGLKPRSPREPRPDSKQQLGQKRDHRPLHYHTPTRASSRIRFSGGTAVWADPATDARLKKRIVRTLIHEVIADIEPQAGEIILVLHWAGGVHAELRLPGRRGRRNSTAVEIIEAVRVLVRIAADDLIAGLLNRNRLTTGHGNRWIRERVTSLRSHHQIPAYCRQARDSEG